MTVLATFVLPYPRGEARIREGANGRKDKTGKRWEFSFLLARKVLAFFRSVSRRWSTPEHPCTYFLSRYSSPVFSLLSHHCHNVILKLRYHPSTLLLLRTESNIETKHKYKWLSDLHEREKEREKWNSALDYCNGNRCENSRGMNAKYRYSVVAFKWKIVKKKIDKSKKNLQEILCPMKH